ncbi:hypothetical protein CI257_17565 [Escherichia coli]|nr:hypothetical protein CI257_17565 [Escherichia coli]
MTNSYFPESFRTEAWLRGNRSTLQHNHCTQEANLLCIHAATYQAASDLHIHRTRQHTCSHLQ